MERFLTKLMNNRRNQINLEEEIDINMKGKFKLLGHIGLMLFVVSALVLTLAPVAQAATAVTEVWVQFLADPWNTEGGAPDFTIHFTPATALSRGVDTITVWFPDGSTAMGPGSFSLSSAQDDATYYVVDRDAEAITYSATDCTSDAVLSQSGYRITVTTPVDLDAGTECSLLVEDGAVVTCSSEASTLPYYIKVYTSQDTTPVASDAFDIDTTGPTLLDVSLSPDTAGSASQYTFSMTLPGALTADTHTVTVIFPYGTTMPSEITADKVSFQNGSGAWETCTIDPTVNQKARMITATTPITLAQAAAQKIRFSNSANIKNPTTATTYAHYYACTSTDELFKLENGSVTIDSNSASQIGFDNDAISNYSDSAAMIDCYSSELYVQVQDQYGNLVDDVSPNQTISFATSQSATGAFFTESGDAYTQVSNVTSSSGAKTIHYKDSAAGTVTLTATCSTYPSGSGTWTITITPGVGLYDSNDNLIKTYAPPSTYAKEKSDLKHGGDYIQDAINASVTGDTVKLGGTAEKPAIYELDTLLTLSKKITLTSATSASYTTLRNTTTLEKAIDVTCDGTATNPVIIDGLTIERLRSGTEIRRAVFNDTYDYVTVRNCTFNYIQPYVHMDTDKPGGVVVFTIDKTWSGNPATPDDITSATVSNNTFNNCCTSWSVMGDSNAANIVFIIRYTAGGVNTPYIITGATISGNEMNNCSGYGISLKGYILNSYITASITNNTITNGFNPINLSGYTKDVAITGNTVTGAYRYGIEAENYSWWTEETLNPYYNSAHDGVVIKNNTITGTAGSYAVWLGTTDRTTTPARTGPVVQYNTISGNNGYAIGAGLATIAGAGQDCKYNWFGDATGPAYTALVGATVTKSNPNGTGDAITDKVAYYPWLHKSLTDVVNDNASYQACTMSLVSGWNTLSTPVQLISTADSIDELIPAHMTIGYYYDATGWHQVTTDVLNPCDAFYIKMSVATDVLLKFDASAWTTPSKDLTAGWNLISLAALDSDGKLADVAVASVYQTAAGLPGYSQVISPSQNATQYDMYYNAGGSWSYSSGQTADADSMLAGLGYWCYMQNAATLAGFEITPIAPDLD